MIRMLFIAVGLLLSSCTSNKEVYNKQTSQIVTANTVDTVENELKKADKDTLVIFDCDGVLTTERDQVMKVNHRKTLNELIEKTMGDANKATQLKYMSLILKSRKTYVVNNRLPAIVSDLQSKNIKTVVLTGFAASGPLGDLTDPAKWRIDILKKLGFDFAKSWPGLHDKFFKYFFSPCDPYYSRGVIFCGDISKPQCLSGFMKHAGIKPSKIIFIDDSLKNVQELQNFCKEADIPYIGIEYIEANKIVSSLPFSEERAAFQFKTLKEKGVWLSDEEAEKKLGSKRS